MSQVKQINVPDIGGATNVEVIEVAVKPGDQVEKEATLLTLESEKASIDIPCPMAGTIKEVKVKVGDKVSEGNLIILLETADTNSAQPAQGAAKPVAEVPAESHAKKEEASKAAIVVPDIGTESAIEVIEVTIKVGDEITKDATLMTLESEKASLDIPSPYAGKVEQVSVKVGDKVKKGDIVGYVITNSSTPAAQQSTAQQENRKAEPASMLKQEVETPKVTPMPNIDSSGDIHAGPAVRRLAYQLGVDLSKVAGTGRKERILPEDLHAYVKRAMQGQGAGVANTGGVGLNLLPWPNVDFAKFGEVDVQPLSRIKKISGANLHRNWVMIPHVTQFEEADITEMEEFRQNNKQQAEKEGAKLTPLVFIMKAVVAALKKYPKFNASLDVSGENLVMKKYFHIGVAVDTPNGLVVPVIRDVDQKSLIQLSKELAEVSKKARDGKLSPADMQGGCFSISSLGGIGGTAFTPIVNAPEVAILGVSKSEIKPKFMQDEFKARLMLPLSLSYDHRVIDGADAARFAAYLAECLGDIRRLLL